MRYRENLLHFFLWLGALRPLRRKKFQRIFARMQKLSTNFSLDEFCRSTVADELGVDNTPPPRFENSLRLLVIDILQPVRDHFGAAATVNSGYRCPAVNDAVGGARNSQHTRCEAADFNIAGVPAHEVAWWIKNSNLPFDQVIFEARKDGTEWVHVSRADHPRGQALQANFDHNGKVTYAPLEAPA